MATPAAPATSAKAAAPTSSPQVTPSAPGESGQPEAVGEGTDSDASDGGESESRGLFGGDSAPPGFEGVIEDRKARRQKQKSTEESDGGTAFERVFGKAKKAKAQSAGVIDGGKSQDADAESEGAEARAQAGEPAEAGADASADATSDANLQVNPNADHHLRQLTGKVSRETAHFFRTMAGQYKSFERRTKDAVASAHGWKAEADRLKSQVAQPAPASAVPANVKPANPNPNQSAADANPSEARKGLIDRFDWRSFDREYRENPNVAIAALADEIDRDVSTRLEALEARLNEQYFEPANQDKQAMQALQKEQKFLYGMQDLVADSGEAFYPEISSDDKRVVDAVITLWRRQPEQYRNTREGFHAAILMYRDMLARHGQAQAPGQAHSRSPDSSSSAPSAARALASEAADMTRESSSVLVPGSASSSPRPSAARGRVRSEGEIMVDAIDKAGEYYDSNLGFSRR